MEKEDSQERKNLKISNQRSSVDKSLESETKPQIRSFNPREQSEGKKKPMFQHRSIDNSFENSSFDNSGNIGENLTPNQSKIENADLEADRRKRRERLKGLKVKEHYHERSRFLCSFCGGKKCKHEDWTLIKRPAIKGLNSNFITEDIIASQRLSKRLMEEFKIVDQFLKINLKAVFNLQEPGEHVRCGDGVLEGKGFSYDFDDLGRHQIQVQNFYWEDMTCPSVDTIMMIVRGMNKIQQENKGCKLLVHCHAGRGRTGIIIASYLVYRDYMSAKDAISLFRERREKRALDSKKQQKSVVQFERYLKKISVNFDPKAKLGINDIIKNQNKLYLIENLSTERYVPKIVIKILDRLVYLKDEGIASQTTILKSFYDVSNKLHFKNPWSQEREDKLVELKLECNNRNLYEIDLIEDPRILAQLFLDFLSNLYSSLVPYSFFEEFKSIFHDRDNSILFFKGRLPGMTLRGTDKNKKQKVKRKTRKLRMEVYHLLAFTAKVLYAVVGYKPKPEIISELTPCILRISISMLKSRNKNEDYFSERNFLLVSDVKKLHKENQLSLLLTTWVLNFNNEYTEEYKALNSANPHFGIKLLESTGMASHSTKERFTSSLKSTVKKFKESSEVIMVQNGEEDDRITEKSSDMDTGRDPIFEDKVITDYFKCFQEADKEVQEELLKTLYGIMGDREVV